MNMTEYSELLVTFLWTPGWWWFGGDRDKILSWHDLTPDLLNNQSWVRNKLIQKKPTSDECHLSPLSSICSGVILLSSQGTSRNLSIFQRQIFLKQIVFYAFIISWIWVKINISGVDWVTWEEWDEWELQWWSWRCQDPWDRCTRWQHGEREQELLIKSESVSKSSFIIIYSR